MENNVQTFFQEVVLIPCHRYLANCLDGTVASEGLKDMVIRTDIDQKQLVATPSFYKESDNILEIILKDGDKVISKKQATCSNNTCIVLPVKNMKLWSPESPFLYELTYLVKDKSGKVLDKVESYTGMRKIHISDGIFYLNNQPYFQRLVLDQGYYPRRNMDCSIRRSA